MPGATHGITVEHALGKRPAIVAAFRADRENLLADPRQQNVVFADMTGEHGAVAEFRCRHACREVWSAGLALCRHVVLPCRCKL